MSQKPKIIHEAFKVYQDALGKLTQEAERNILYTAYAKMVLEEAFDKIIHEQIA